MWGVQHPLLMHFVMSITCLMSLWHQKLYVHYVGSFPHCCLIFTDNEKLATVKWLTWYITEVFWQLLATQENREGISSIIWFMYLANLHRIVNKVIVNDLQPVSRIL